MEEEKGFEVRGLVSRPLEGKPNGESPCVEMGDKESVADCGGVNVNPPKAGVIPVGEMWESIGPRLKVSMLRGRIMFPSGKLGV